MLQPAPDLFDRVTAQFAVHHDGAPSWVARAPGRVNVVGEHTDYLGGLCLPLALPYATWVAAAPRDDDRLHLTSTAAEPWTGDATRHLGPGPVRPRGWAAYVVGALRAVGHTGGLRLHVESSVPVGAGLSSSAALVCAVATAVTERSAQDLLAPSIWAEQVAVGAPTGGMDQSVALLARTGHVLALDFSHGTLPSAQLHPWHPERAGLELVVVDTGTRHTHEDGAFAQRRSEGEAALRLHPDELGAAPEALRRRRRHVETESLRVREVVEAARTDDWRAVGGLLLASHESLRHDYQVSNPALDHAVEAATAAGAWGARMTGGGFGGCAVVLAPRTLRNEVAHAVRRAAATHGHPEPRFLHGDANGPATRLRVAGPTAGEGVAQLT